MLPYCHHFLKRYKLACVHVYRWMCTDLCAQIWKYKEICKNLIHLSTPNGQISSAWLITHKCLVWTRCICIKICLYSNVLAPILVLIRMTKQNKKMEIEDHGSSKNKRGGDVSNGRESFSSKRWSHSEQNSQMAEMQRKRSYRMLVSVIKKNIICLVLRTVGMLQMFTRNLKEQFDRYEQT